MNIVNQVTRLVQSRATANPKTTLGFYAAAIIAILTSSVAISGILASQGVLIAMIPYILGTGAGLATLISIGVFVINFKRPQNLMLGEITGREYAAIERVTLGDSRQGERVVVAERVNSSHVEVAQHATSDSLEVAPRVRNSRGIESGGRS